MLANPRHERFVQNVIEGMPASRAYVAAGFKARGNSAETAAGRLLRNVQISARLSELRSRQASRHDVTIDKIAAQLDEDRALAQRLGRPRPPWRLPSPRPGFTASWLIAAKSRRASPGRCAHPVRILRK